MKPKVRFIEGRFVFQVASDDGDPDHAQFSIAIFLRDGKIRTAFDINNDAPGVENIDVHVAEAILAAAEMVKGKIKPGELHEQTE